MESYQLVQAVSLYTHAPHTCTCVPFHTRSLTVVGDEERSVPGQAQGCQADAVRDTAGEDGQRAEGRPGRRLERVPVCPGLRVLCWAPSALVALAGDVSGVQEHAPGLPGCPVTRHTPRLLEPGERLCHGAPGPRSGWLPAPDLRTGHALP